MNDWDAVVASHDADAEDVFEPPTGLIAAFIVGLIALVVAIAALVIWLTSPVAHAQVRTPLATEADRVLAPLFVNRNGTEFTFRASADDSLLICVEPRAGMFGPRTCFSIADVRRGRLVRR